MEFKLVLVTLFSVLAFVLPSTNAQQVNPEVSQLEAFYYNKCLKNSGGTAAFDKLRTDVYEMYKYFEYSFQLLPDRRKTFCSDARSNMEARLSVLADDLKPCLAIGERYLSTFVKDVLEEILNFFCRNNGLYTTRFFTERATQCRQKIEQSNTSDLDNCLNRIFAPTKSYISKKEMCDDVTVAKKCFVQLLEVHCPTHEDFKRVNEIFFNHVSKPCNGNYVHLMSSFILIGSLLMHFAMKKLLN